MQTPICFFAVSKSSAVFPTNKKGVIYPASDNFFSRDFYRQLCLYKDLYPPSNFPVHIYGKPCDVPQSNLINAVTSNSTVPLTTPGGDIITYTNVAEYYDTSKSSFKTEYTFSFQQDGSSTQYPLPQNVYADWRSGMLTSKAQYEKTTAGYRQIIREEHFYQNYITRVNDAFGIGIGPSFTPGFFNTTNYTFTSEWYVSDSVHTTTYDDASSATKNIASGTKYFYTPNYDVRDTRTINSKGQVIEKKVWYPYDYSNVGSYNIGSLLNNFIMQLPVKQESSLNSKITSGIIMGYNTMGQPLNVYTYDDNTLVDTVAHNMNTVLEPNYASNTSISYDVNNNLSSAVTRAGYPVTYLYGYSSQYPVAKITGADYGTASMLINQATLDNPADDSAMRNELNKLRIGLPNSLVYTYTYAPLIGKTSETDPAGHITYLNMMAMGG